MKKLFISATVLFSTLFGFGLGVTPTYAAPSYTFGDTASSEDACEALKRLNPDNKGCGAAQGGVNTIIRVALNLLSFIAGVIAVIMIIVSGFKYVTAQGDANQISSAKNSLLYAIVGLVVVAFAQAIVKFALSKSINA